MSDSFNRVVGLLALSGIAILFISYLGQHGVYTTISIFVSWFLSLQWFNKGYVIGFGLLGVSVAMVILRDYFRGVSI